MWMAAKEPQWRRFNHHRHAAHRFSGVRRHMSKVNLASSRDVGTHTLGLFLLAI